VRTVDTIVAAVMQKLDPMLKMVDHVADTAQEATGDTSKAVDHLYRTGEKMRDELQWRMEAVKEDMQRSADRIREEINS